MGGRGSASGLAKIVAFSAKGSAGAGNNEKWDYRGYVESVDNVEKAVNSVKTRRQVEQAYKGITSAEESVSAEISRIENGGGDEGDVRVLMTQRRRLRQLRRKLVQKEIL